MGKRTLTPSEWLRILTSNIITASDIALVQGCDIKTARRIADELSAGRHRPNATHTCPLESYLQKYKYTSKREEMKAIYGEVDS